MRCPRVLIVGAGHMGLLHAEKMRELETKGMVELVAIADVDEERCRSVLPGHPSVRVRDYRYLLNQIDAAVVAIPTVEHFSSVKECLVAGVHVLVEKPISTTVDEGVILLSLAKRHQCVLQVGHIEWFNPTLLAIVDQIRDPHFIEANRVGPFSKRGSDVDIVRDLMIHDIDIVQRLFGEEPETVDSIGVSFVTDKVDLAKSTMRFSGGHVAHLTASRVAEVPVRDIQIFQGEECFYLDLLKKTLVVTSQKHGAGNQRDDIHSTDGKVDSSDALLNEIKVFVESVKQGKTLIDSAEAGVSALRTASRIVDGISDPGGNRKGVSVSH